MKIFGISKQIASPFVRVYWHELGLETEENICKMEENK